MSENQTVPLMALKVISKNFGRVEALKNLSFEVNRGESVGLVLNLAGLVVQ